MHLVLVNALLLIDVFAYELLHTVCRGAAGVRIGVYSFSYLLQVEDFLLIDSLLAIHHHKLIVSARCMDNLQSGSLYAHASSISLRMSLLKRSMLASIKYARHLHVRALACVL